MSLFDLPAPEPAPAPRSEFGCGTCGASFGHRSGCSADPEPIARARYSDPVTSHEAAESITGEKIRESQSIVLGLLRAHGPMTDETLVAVVEARGLALSPSGARTRRAELVELGFVEASGERARLRSGRSAAVWRVVP